MNRTGGEDTDQLLFAQLSRLLRLKAMTNFLSMWNRSTTRVLMRYTNDLVFSRYNPNPI